MESMHTSNLPLSLSQSLAHPDLESVSSDVQLPQRCSQDSDSAFSPTTVQIGGRPVSFTGTSSEVSFGTLPEDIQDALEKVGMKDVLLVECPALCGMESYNSADMNQSTLTILDPWNRITRDKNPVRTRTVVISPSLVFEEDNAYKKVTTARRGNCLRGIRAALGNDTNNVEEFQEMRAWLHNRSEVWVPMFISRSVRAKYRKLAHSPELRAYKSSSSPARPFMTPRRLCQLHHKARQDVEDIAGQAFNADALKVEATQRTVCREKLGIMLQEMDGDEDETSSGGESDGL